MTLVPLYVFASTPWPGCKIDKIINFSFCELAGDPLRSSSFSLNWHHPHGAHRMNSLAALGGVFTAGTTGSTRRHDPGQLTTISLPHINYEQDAST